MTFPGGITWAQTSDPGLINLGHVSGLFLPETLVPDHRDSSERTSWGCYPQEGPVAGTASFMDPLGPSVVSSS